MFNTPVVPSVGKSRISRHLPRLASGPGEKVGLAARSAGWPARLARRLATARLAAIAEGRLEIREAGERALFGGGGAEVPPATVEVHDPAFWERLAWGGSIGAAEAYCEGLWSSPDLTAVIRLLARNRDAMEGLESSGGALAEPLRRLLHRLRANTRSGSRRNIAAHYDAGEALFSRFLDPTLTYSCAVFPDATSGLETAQRWKLGMVCRKLELSRDDHLLEIGTGWGGLAIHAARHHGCRVTTTTISRRQHDFATRAVREAGLEDRVQVLLRDYRELPKTLGRRFDKLVSIEMIEAVGHRYHPIYFHVIDRMLEPHGLALLQAITIPDQIYDTYRRSVDFIQKHVFPGGLLPSMARIQDCVRGATELRLLDVEDLTPHYARTLEAWSDRFTANQAEIAALGLTEPERRKWLYYFAYCRGGFLERVIGVSQLLFAKPRNRREAPVRSFA